MDQYHEGMTKKVGSGTGGKSRKYRDKSLAHVGGKFAATKVSEKDVRVNRRKRGGSSALKLKKAGLINITTKEGTKKEQIIRVIESHNPEFIRQNVITRGAVVETKIGKVKITNRPGRDGIVNGVLLK